MQARLPRPNPRTGVILSLLLSAVSLLAVGAVGPLHFAILVTAAVITRRLRWPGMTGWNIMAVAALAFFFADLTSLSRDLIGSALRLMSFVVVHRCLTVRGKGDLRRCLSLSFVQMVAAAASTTEAWFSLFLIAYVTAGVSTLMSFASWREGTGTKQAVRSPGPPALMSVSTAVAGIAIFFVIPHFGTGYFQPLSAQVHQRETMSGFSERVELGSINRIKLNDTLVMRVRPEGIQPDRPLYWRGVALDTFDGRSWSTSLTDRYWLERRFDGTLPFDGGAGQPQGEFSFELEPMMIRVVFMPPDPLVIRSEVIHVVGIDADDSFYLGGMPVRRIGYRVASGPKQIPVEPLTDHHRERLLEIPSLDPRIPDIVSGITAGAASDFEKARRIEDHLRENYTYSLQVNDAGVSDPLRHFLIERNPGHCEYFATSMAVMLRSIGIPARIVTGFTEGEWSPLIGSWLVRQSDAHSWVEAWAPERGWITFDPTPPSDQTAGGPGLIASIMRGFDKMEIAWDTWIIGLDLMDQQSLATSLYESIASVSRSLGGVTKWVEAAARRLLPDGWEKLGLVMAGLALLPILPLLRWRHGSGPSRHGATHPATVRLRRFEARWAARGLRRGSAETPLQFTRTIESARGESAGAREFVRSYYRARFGG